MSALFGDIGSVPRTLIDPSPGRDTKRTTPLILANSLDALSEGCAMSHYIRATPAMRRYVDLTDSAFLADLAWDPGLAHISLVDVLLEKLSKLVLVLGQTEFATD